MDPPTFLTHTVNSENNTVSENQSIKRKRLTQACDACRKKKVKCSGEKPSCNNCSRLGISCTYIPSTRKRGPRVGLVESLEKRLQQMEKLLQPLKEQGIVDDMEDKKSVKKPRLNRLNINNNFDPNSEIPINNYNDSKDQQSPQFGQTEFINIFSQPSQVEPPPQPPPQSQQPTPDKSSNDDDDEPLFFGKSAANPGFRSMKELFIHCNQDLPIKSELSEIGEYSPTSESNDSINSNPKISPISAMIRSRSNGLPPSDIVEHLAACFFRHIDIQMPMFHEATFMRHLRQNKVAPFLVFAICAASARFSDHPSITRNPPYMSGEPFATFANDYLFGTFDNPSVEHVQGLLLISIYMYGVGKGPKAWMFSGMAVRMSQELGLHKVDEVSLEPKSNPERFFIQKEIKRRTFWSCFLLDRFSACALGRPTLIDEDDCDVRLPCSESIWNLEHPLDSPLIDEFLKERRVKKDARLTLANTGMSACLVSITALLGRVCQHVNRSKPTSALLPWDPNSQFTLLERELEDWYNLLSPHYSYNRDRMRQLTADGLGATFASIHLLYYSAIVVLNRPNIASLQNEEVADCHVDFMRASAERCSGAAKFVSSIAADVSQYGCQFMCPFILYPIFATTTIHLNDIYSLDVRIAEEAERNLSINEHFMKLMGPYWAMSSRLYNIVKEMRNSRCDNHNSKALTKNAFFFKRKNSEDISMNISTEFKWDRFDDDTITEANLDSISSIILPEQLSSPRWYNDSTIMGDTWTSFLRSPSPLTPRALRLTRKDDNNSNQQDNNSLDDYFSQDLTAYNSIQAPPAFIYDGYSMVDMPLTLDWPTTAAGKIFPLNRPIKHWTNINGNIMDSAIDDTSNTSFTTSSTTSTVDINIDPLLI